MDAQSFIYEMTKILSLVKFAQVIANELQKDSESYSKAQAENSDSRALFDSSNC